MYYDYSSQYADWTVGRPYGDYTSLLAGDDTLIGSYNGYSTEASLYEGNDYIEIHSGIYNNIWGNHGDDTLALYKSGSGVTCGRFRGGKGNDTITIEDGVYVGTSGDFINGNNGADTIKNWGKAVGKVRGGKDDDWIINYEGSMDAYGDKGSDTFTPYYGFADNYSTGMTVKDFQVGYDVLDTSALGSEVTQELGTFGGVQGLLIDAYGASYGWQLCAFLEGVDTYI